MNKRFIILFVLMLSLWTFIISNSTAGNTPDIRGVWYPDLYILKDGTKQIVKGYIFFGEKDWLVLFYVINENQETLFGSAEGGVYSLNENRLVLKHLYNLSAGQELAGVPIKPSNMEIKDVLNARVEPCTVEIKGDILTIYFPSGNRMTFKSATSGAHRDAKDLRVQTYDPICYTVSAEVAVPAEVAFDYLCDLKKLGRWALGCFNTEPTEQEGLFVGTSLFDGTRLWVGIETDPHRFIIDYRIGDADHQIPRISTRVVPGPAYGNDVQHCIVIMTAWRPTDMSVSRWHRLCATHDVEILLIQSQIK